MAEIDNYQDSSVDASDNVESSDGESDSEESSRDTSRDEDYHLSLPICVRDISGELYDLETWLDEGEIYNEKKNACYAPYGFPWAFLVWINEVFLYLEKYVGKSLDTPLPIPRLLRWYTSKSDNIVEGDPFKYKGRNEVKDAVIDVLKTQLKGVTVLTTENLSDRVVFLEQSMVKVVAYVREEKLRRIEKNKKNKRKLMKSFATVDEDFAAIDEVAVDVVDKVIGYHVDEVAVDETAGDEVACVVNSVTVVDVVDEATIDEVAIDVVDEVAVTVDDVAVEVAVDAKAIDSMTVDDVAGAVDPVAVDVIDEVAVTIDDVAGVVDPVTVDIIDEVAGGAVDEVAEEKEEEKKKEKSIDDEEDECAENSVDVMSIVVELNGEEKNN
ncbi:hypothetical protein KY285_007372 [Solanum tuberosum]|nr:hypothetical protein KY285_007372 [Solanum tuberosum]